MGIEVGGIIGLLHLLLRLGKDAEERCEHRSAPLR
jgi:hypothetical protein